MRNVSWRLGIAAVIGLGVLGTAACEKQVREARSDDPAAKNVATAAPATTLPANGDAIPAADSLAAQPPASAPAETQPAPLVTLSINGVLVNFPPTKLVLHAGKDNVPAAERATASAVKAELFSDLPKSALRKYDGNELYFEMTLDRPAPVAAAPDARETADPAAPDDSYRIEGAVWTFKAASSDKSDAPDGIFLDGQAVHLQPYAVGVRIERGGGRPVAHIVGKFRLYESGTPAALAPVVDVEGKLSVEIASER